MDTLESAVAVARADAASGRKRRDRDEEFVIGETGNPLAYTIGSEDYVPLLKDKEELDFDSEEEEYEGNGPMAGGPDLSYRQAAKILDIGMTDYGRRFKRHRPDLIPIRTGLRYDRSSKKWYYPPGYPKKKPIVSKSVAVLRKCSRCNRPGHYAKDCFATTYLTPSGSKIPIKDVASSSHIRGDSNYIHYYKIPPGVPDKFGKLRPFKPDAGNHKKHVPYYGKKWSNKLQRFI